MNEWRISIKNRLFGIHYLLWCPNEHLNIIGWYDRLKNEGVCSTRTNCPDCKRSIPIDTLNRLKFLVKLNEL